MVYITSKQPVLHRQMTIEELLFSDSGKSVIINSNESNTRTSRYNVLPERFQRLCDVGKLTSILEEFNRETKELRTTNREKLYTTFYVPKNSGHGYRRIDAPCSELMEALRKLKLIFENDFRALYHTSAFAYIKNRCTVDAVKRHQANESKWFGKFDLSNFFGNTTMDFVLQQFAMIFPFSEVMKTERGKSALQTALDLAFLNGGLPQGTPISPTITNIMMIPIDFKLSNGFRNFNEQSFVYTRYADDFIISSRTDFDYKAVEKFIVDTLREFTAPFTLNAEKSRYGSSAGRNWILGVMLNKDNKITVGSKRKREFKAMLSNYILDRRNGMPWSLEDVQILYGYCNYYSMVEGETIDRIVDHVGTKYGVNIIQMLLKDLEA